ncbi:hypothetical protein JRQ81_017671 [Phrynocephalus forsythii]|uniref:Maestro/Maestro-like HEAT-repeats domain-containing protein n=1 Tax=Phrynocephalus forsythii TaxID=171643 RepID=A0A9Q0XQS0_9SAUR|nr:hypothetical protein JRQ81_017671 [Phrynocephalus forsythii]
MGAKMNWEDSSPGKLTANLEKATSSVSSPRHADSPTSVSSSGSSDSEGDVKDVLGFMQKFLSENRQDISERLKFLDCVDLITTTLDREKKEWFGDHHSNQSLMRDTLKFLLEETASSEAQEREVALARITKLIGCITSHCVVKLDIHSDLSCIGALLRNEGCERMLPYLLATLETKEDTIHVIAMTFIVEILDTKTLDEPTENLIIQHLFTQLKSNKVQLRILSLNGMLRLTAYPKKMAKLKPALPDLLARLKEANREINVKALKVLEYLLKTLDAEELNLFTMEVAARVIPLFDDASNKVRVAAISTFNCLLEVTRRGSKDQMKQFTMESLVPLMVHLHDESIQVAEASWATLRKADQFLKSFLQLPIHENDPWSLSASLVKRYRELGEGVLLEQAFGYLENPRRSLRNGAIKLLEIMAQATKHKDTVAAIRTGRVLLGLSYLLLFVFHGLDTWPESPSPAHLAPIPPV